LMCCMLHPNDINLVALNCYVPSGVFSGSLVQLLTYLQNSNFRPWRVKFFEADSSPYESLRHRARAHAHRWTASSKAFAPFDCTRPKRREDKKDFHSC
jgi:hypothetical protein